METVKTYNIGDTISFYAAKKNYSLHVGDTYYLIGRTVLDNEKSIEFEYYFSNYSSHIWDTEAKFINRTQNELLGL